MRLLTVATLTLSTFVVTARAQAPSTAAAGASPPSSFDVASVGRNTTGVLLVRVLKSARGPVDVLVIDSVHPPTPN